MNALGAAARPFLFVVDYAEEQILVQPLEEVDAHEIRYDFPTADNLPHAPHNAPLPSPETPLWEAQPPTLETYARSFDLVKRNLHAGNSFLTNLTCHIPLRTPLSLHQIFQHSDARYRLWWRDRFVCFSPETFVRIRGGEISAFPMKGTAPDTTPDALQALLDDSKERAEHATIVDLIRNDLSIIATRVEVRRYRYVDRLATHRGPLLQTSSEIVGQLPSDWRSRLGTLLFRLLPAGSITGAPKPKTCQIIAQAETHPRGYYTGVMGIFDGENLDSAVMIRFVEQAPDGTLAFKAGGGITARSVLEKEYDEILQKVYLPLRPVL